MSKEKLNVLLRQGPVFLDGATGSNLMRAGKPVGVCSEQWILEHPEVLLKLQRSYLDAGTQILIAPTFTANSYYLAQHGLEDQLYVINRELVKLSRSAGECLIAGDMTTLGRPDISYEELLQVYSQQAAALRDAGADLYMIETMMGLEETMAALEACKMASDLPVFCSFSVNGDGTLYFGGSIYDAATQLEGFGADAVGINCSAGPDQLLNIVETLHRELSVPVLAKPNAGIPVMDEFGVAHYSMNAEDFGKHMMAIKNAGAAILGGCCGTEPAHIAEMVKVCK